MHNLGVSGYNFQKKYCILKICFINSVDPGEMQHDGAFHLCLHCLQKCSFRGFKVDKFPIINRSLERFLSIWLI